MMLKTAFVKKGGRKCCLDSTPEIAQAVERIVADHTAGDPMRDNVKWTYLSIPEVTSELWRVGFHLHDQTVAKILEELDFSRRRAERRITMGHFPQRDEQFQIIAGLKQQYLDSGDPIFSIDAKKKEYLGNFFREGRVLSTGNLPTYDHDFHGDGGGHVVSHGIFDTTRNTGHITLGLSYETSEFACDSFALYWNRYGQRAYPRARSILWLCDGGGSNNARHYIFKEDLQKLVNKIGVPIRVAHYPPYCSKYNPIERRMFSHVTRACQGVIFHTVDIVKRMIERTWTSEGLSVTVAVITKAYEKGREASARFMQAFPIQFDDRLPLLNYTVVPTAY
jgi:Rhodopirellula transposase DDE domain